MIMDSIIKTDRQTDRQDNSAFFYMVFKLTKAITLHRYVLLSIFFFINLNM